MISKLEDYKLLTGANADPDLCPLGDLDRIFITGGIMPLRDSIRDPENSLNWKNVLRGEDITFLAEALAERCNFWTRANGAFIEFGGAVNANVFGATEFERFYSYDGSNPHPTPRGLASFFSRIFSLTGGDSRYVLDPSAVPPSVIAIEDTSSSISLDDMLARIYTPLSASDLAFDMDADFPSGRPNLLRYRIEKLFETLAKVNGVAIHSPVEISSVSNGNLHRIEKSGSVDDHSPADSLGYFSRNGQNGVDDYWAISYLNTWAREVPTLSLVQPSPRVDPDSVVFFLVTRWETSTLSSRQGQVDLRRFWTVSPMPVTDTSSGYVRDMAHACGVDLRTIPEPTPENPEIIQFRFEAIESHAVGVYTFGDHTRWP